MDGSRGTIFFLPFRDTSSSTSCMKLAISGGSRWISLSLSPSFRNLTSWKNCWKTKQVHVGLTDICNANFLPNMECKTVSSLVFPGGSVVKNLPAIAGDMGSIPDPRRSHMPWSDKARVPQLLSLCSRAHAPQRLKPVRPRARALQQEKPPPREAHASQPENWPHLLQLEKSPSSK